MKSPSTIRPAYGGYLVEDDQSDKILYVNDHLELLDDPILIGNRKMADNLRLLEVYDWSPMSEGILAFGDLESPEEYQESAFLYFDFDDAGQNQIFYRIAITDNVRNHYTRNMPYIATLGNVGYILFMDERPAIGEVTFGEGIRRLQFFPEDFRSRPQLVRREAWTNAGMGARQATHFYKSLEMSTMAAGLYAWDGYLYLLAKEAIAQNGETAWWLIKLDPRDGMELSRVRLPTGAAHLTVVTGEVWGFIEKGPVQGIGAMHGPYMKTDSMVLIPAGWLEDPYGGRLDARSRTHCVKSRQFTTKD
ncbi:MAG: hypothetical protein GY835_03540 [bacterium]|nr:hypothetical protein [bacterium]